MSIDTDGEQIRRLLKKEAREITGARYAALGRTVGDSCAGGVLGAVIDDPQPLRLADVGEHPRIYGFPIGHQPMRSFLGVPIIIPGEAWGNLYLTETDDGDEFTAADEEATVVLAQWAATAIENARLNESSEQSREQLERAVGSLEAARDIADAISGVSDLDRVLELSVKRGRAFVDARSILIMLREGDELVVAASAGHAKGARGRRLPVSRSTSGEVLEQGRAERLTDIESRLRIGPRELGVPDARSAMLVPMLHHGTR